MNSFFVIVRFAPGSGGKFLSSVIQASTAVDHWSTVVQDHKNHEILFPQLISHYFDRSFPADHSMALRNEPHSPYCTKLYSSSYSRGNDVTLQQYLMNTQCANDIRFLDCQRQGRLVNLTFHKPEIPKFCDGSLVVTITIESEAEQQWVSQTLWRKHWIEFDGVLVHAPDDPVYCHITQLPQVLQYQNKSRYPATLKSQLQDKFVYQNHTREWYLDSNKFQEHDQLHDLQNVFIPLSSFFDRDQFIDMINNLFCKLQLDPVHVDLVDCMRSIWTARQNPFNA